MVAVWDFGVRFIVLLQSWGSWLLTPMKAVSFLGTEDFFMAVLPVVYWCVDAALGMQVAVLLMLSNQVNGFFKNAFHGPRPYWYSSQVTAYAQETSFGVPSGHTQNATVIWGTLAAWLRKGWAWAVAALLVILTGLSRMFLGVHFPHDIAAGLLIGAVLLVLLVTLWKPVSEWAKKLSLGWKVLVSLVVSLVLMLLPMIPFLWLAGWQAPSGWAAYAAGALAGQDNYSVPGTLFGLLIGYAWIQLNGGFDTKGKLWMLLARFVLGLVGVLAIRYGLKAIFPAGTNTVAYAFQYLRYAVIGFWVTGGAPWVFIKLKLSQRKEPVLVQHYDSLTGQAAQ